MLKLILITYIVAVMFHTAAAQEQLPNPDFEEWVLFKGSGQFSDYDEPAGWASGNSVVHIAMGAKPPLSKTDKAYQGNFAAKLETQLIFGQIAAGNLFTGKFKLNLTDPLKSTQFGIPFSSRPKRFQGWFIYEPKHGDSADMYCILAKWNPVKGARDTIAEARKKIYETVPEYTYFDIEFDYRSEESPDTIWAVFTSSSGGALFQGVVGSTLYVDMINLDYETSVLSDFAKEKSLQIYPNPAGHWLEISVNSGSDYFGNACPTAAKNDYSDRFWECYKSEIRIYNVLGECVMVEAAGTEIEFKKRVNVSHLRAGIYLVRFGTLNEIFIKE